MGGRCLLPRPAAFAAAGRHAGAQPKQGSLFRHDKYDEIRKTVELHFSGTAQDIYSDFSVVCTDSTISGSVRAGDGVTCTDVGGDVTAGDDVTCGNVGGNVQAGDSVHCTGDVQGNVRASDSVTCGNVGGDVSASDSVRCGEVKGKKRGLKRSRFFPCHRGGFVLP